MFFTPYNDKHKDDDQLEIDSVSSVEKTKIEYSFNTLLANRKKVNKDQIYILNTHFHKEKSSKE